MHTEKAAMLFEGWDDALIWSCLQGHMGTMITDNDADPASALIDAGDLCFFTGKPNPNLFNSVTGSKFLIPKDRQWESLIESFYGNRVKRFFRYAIKKEPNVFDRKKLTAYTKAPARCFVLKLFNEEIYHMALSEAWSADLCSQFKNYADYKKRAVGAAILHQGKLVSGASTYAVYDGGIDIQIDTKLEYRRKGLATACGAKIILECLDRNIYPGWDAHDLRSVALAEKLGYRLDRAYVTYELFDA